MLKDITIGQHFPGNSPVHRLDPRIKILVTIAYVVFLFLSTNVAGLVLSVALIFILYGVAKIPIKLLKKSLKPILPIIMFTVILNLFFIKGETPLIDIGFLKIYPEAVVFIIVMISRILLLICGTSLLTYTTSTIALTDGLEALMKPLNKVHFPVHEMAMMMTIALRFIPTLIEETEKIMNAQKSRGALLDSGTFMDRIKALVPILVPLFISAFRRAEELATAMECRCYHGGEGRTRLRQLKITNTDIRNTAACVVIFAVILSMKLFFKRVI